MSDQIDRGAVAAIDLLLRCWEFGGPGEDSWEEIAEAIRDGITQDGLAVVVARQLDFERDEEPDEEPEPMPASVLAAMTEPEEADHAR